MKHKIFTRAVDLSRANTIVFHLSDGEALAVAVENMDGDMELGLGRICDTSEYNGEVHYFPWGNA
ncbi:MAG: hypothetical protein RQ753_00995 [Desulfurivibrionaceae bacterium]|nr:hypothetical protein [Desulfobulbales bacterium]MDT8334253.1 hypothetical protein [Desulfurivibrionaceae bacterium]